jgi:predicted lipoprotein
MKRLIYLGLFFFILLTNACKEDDSLSKKVDFDRKSLLDHYASHIIPKRYANLNENVVAMDSAWVKVKLNASIENISILRYYFVESYKAWQYCSVLEFGPADQVLLRANVNTFPTDTFKIGSNIRNQSYNLNLASNLDAKGFPALDYLFFKSSTITSFLADVKNQQYIDAVIIDLKEKINTVNAAWNNGTYKAEFISKDGVDIGSSLGQLVNQFNFDLELIKTAKLGIPLGKKTMGTPLPEMVEGYYSGISKDLILLNIHSLKNLFAGNVSDQITGTGLDEYLRAVSAKTNGVDLDVKIIEQLDAARNANEALPSNLSQAIISQPGLVESAYTEVQRCIIYTKTDMPSALGIMITYQDNDGD